MMDAVERLGEVKRHPGGRPRKAPEIKRQKLDIWLAPAELAAVRAKAEAAGLGLRPYVRHAALGRHVRPIPELNRTAWVELSRTAANLNQLARHANAGQGTDSRAVLMLLRQLAAEVARLRMQLIGADYDEDDGDDRQD